MISPRRISSLTVALAVANPPKSLAIVTSKFPSAQFQSSGARDVSKRRGLKELLYLEDEFGTRDFGPIAARIKDANPDLLWRLARMQPGRCSRHR